MGENRAAAKGAAIPVAWVVVAAFALAGAGFAIGGAFLGAFNRGASTYLEGTLTFDAKGDANPPGYALYIWKNGNYRPLAR